MISSTTSNNHKSKKRSTNERKACSNMSGSKFKGVVGQRNSNWGARIYFNHKMVWLGTFKSEKEAAMAYDSAAIRLRGKDSHRNLPWTKFTDQEPKFQAQFATEDILRMIKQGSYPRKFQEFLKEKYEEGYPLKTLQCHKQLLFQKELSQSDVEIKLNRLLIPKKFALKYFPQICNNNGHEFQESKDVEMIFFDSSRRSWKFRYCYWRSNKSFVLTTGWNKFIEDKGLEAKDRVVFSSCEYKIGPTKICMVFEIDVVKQPKFFKLFGELIKY